MGGTLGVRLVVRQCCYLQIGYEDNSLSYRLGQHVLKPDSDARDLGVTVQSNLKPSLHCMQIASKTNARSKLILKSFLSRDPLTLARAFVIYVRSLLEYCTPVWCPYHKNDIGTIENTQRTFTPKLFRMCNLAPASYARLIFLGLHRLELRRIYTDLLFVFKLSHGLIAYELQLALQYIIRRGLRGPRGLRGLRGHRYKLFVPYARKLALSTSFLYRVLSIWNLLPDTCFNVDTFNSFKSKIYDADFTRFFKGRA